MADAKAVKASDELIAAAEIAEVLATLDDVELTGMALLDTDIETLDVVETLYVLPLEIPATALKDPLVSGPTELALTTDVETVVELIAVGATEEAKLSVVDVDELARLPVSGEAIVPDNEPN